MSSEAGPGNPEFQERVAPYRHELRAAARQLTGSPQEADDLVQECLAAALAGLPRLGHRELLGAWLLQILRHKGYDALRRRSRERRALNVARPAAAPAADAAETDLVRHVLAELDPEERRVIELKYFESRTSGEIGEILGKPAGTVRSLLFYALRRFEAAYRRAVQGEVP